MLECDFCSGPQAPVWRYPAKNFKAWEYGSLIGESIEDWACCETCSAIIETDDYQRLVKRSVEVFTDRYGSNEIPQKELVEEMTRIFTLFETNRKGSRVPL